jgi:IS5 family transposase
MIPFAHLDVEGIMARRRIGQQAFRFGAEEERQTSLDELAALIDWPPADFVLAPLYPSAKGEKAWPPLAMFKALLLATWHDLSDVALAEALSDRASFRRFCGFARDEATPERTAFVRFRRQLVAQGSIGACLRRSPAILSPRAPPCARARSSMPP